MYIEVCGINCCLASERHFAATVLGGYNYPKREYASISTFGNQSLEGMTHCNKYCNNGLLYKFFIMVTSVSVIGIT